MISILYNQVFSPLGPNLHASGGYSYQYWLSHYDIFTAVTVMDYFCLLNIYLHNLITLLGWAVPLFILAYFIIDATSMLRLVRRQSKHIPFGSDIVLAPKFIHNFIFASKATSILQKAYKKVCL